MNLRRRTLLLLAAALVMGIFPLMAASVTYTVTGTLGPILSGSDPLGANGQSGTVTAVASTSLNPISKTSTSATYTLPAGAVTVVIGGTSYPTTGTTSMKITESASKTNSMVFTTTVSVDGVSGTIVATVDLAKGSFTASVLKHPTAFKPASQKLTAATKAGGPGSQVSYKAILIGTTVLGLSGTAGS
jgi:hypothetical protein